MTLADCDYGRTEQTGWGATTPSKVVVRMGEDQTPRRRGPRPRPFRGARHPPWHNWHDYGTKKTPSEEGAEINRSNE